MIKNILIIEPEIGGHYGVYLIRVIEHFLAFGYEITLAVDDRLDVDDFIEDNILLLKDDKRLKIIRFRFQRQLNKFNLINLFIEQIRFWRACKSIYRNTKKDIDFVFLPYLDRLTYGLSFIGSPFDHCSFSGIMMRSNFYLKAKRVKIRDMTTTMPEFIKLLLFKKSLKIKTLSNIFTIDQAFYEYAHLNFVTLSNKVKYFPDPVDKPEIVERSKAKKDLNISENSVTLLVYGAIDMRKGIHGALAWVYDNQPGNKKLNLLIAGKQSDDVKTLIADSPIANKLKQIGALFIIDRYVIAKEERLIFSSADLVWLNYVNFNQMSGVMVKAGSFDLPMILPEKGVMGWYKDQLAVSEQYPGFSIPRLRQDLLTNPFDNHTWEKSMKIINDSITSDC